MSSANVLTAEPDDHDGGCWCGESGCPTCGGDCWSCGGMGWGIVGDDFPCNDPLWEQEGSVKKCPNCGGSGDAKDCTFW